MTELTPTRMRLSIEAIRPILLHAITLPQIARPGCAISIVDAAGNNLGDFIIGDLSASAYDNPAIAKQKSALSRRCRCAGSAVTADLKQPDDSEWSGSVWSPLGFAVGCAGLSEAQDEMISHWIAAAIMANITSANLP